MKKKYLKPAMNVYKLELTNTLLAGSDPETDQKIYYFDDEEEEDYEDYEGELG